MKNQIRNYSLSNNKGIGKYSRKFVCDICGHICMGFNEVDAHVDKAKHHTFKSETGGRLSVG